MKNILNILFFFWELPQNLLGLLLTFILSTENCLVYKGKKIRICSWFRGGVSLGNHIWVRGYPNNTRTWNVVKHMWGHARLSRLLGWAYLLVIGLPALIWSAIYSEKMDCSYYDFYTEALADELGGVER